MITEHHHSLLELNFSNNVDIFLAIRIAGHTKNLNRDRKGAKNRMQKLKLKSNQLKQNQQVLSVCYCLTLTHKTFAMPYKKFLTSIYFK